MRKTRLTVVRSESTTLGYMVATHFEQLADEPAISQLSSGPRGDPQGGSGTPTTH
jgi:hypothetical protein